MKTYSILYEDKKVSIVTILPHKETGKYSYVNLTKGHICPCCFDSVEEALDDLKNYNSIEMWEEINI